MKSPQISKHPDRAEARADFLAAAGWKEALATPLAGDASTRSYERLSLNGKTALLMYAPAAAEGAGCPPQASPDERRRLGYNALARLAGPNLNAFLAIDETLRDAGLSAPEIYAADPGAGFALIEDLGDDLYARAIPAGAPEKTLYEAAIDALLALRAAAPKAPSSGNYCMLTYDRVAMKAEVGLLAEWYAPFSTGAAINPDLQAEYLAAWDQTLDGLGAPDTIILRDYHAENLLWLPDREGGARAGMIDFQDGLVGHAAYDLTSLLEDARRDVPRDLAEAMIAHYCKAAGQFAGFDEAALRDEYAILAAQRNAKILGIFARLIQRDGKPRYRDFLPRVEAHFRRGLLHPKLARLGDFFRNFLPGLGA